MKNLLKSALAILLPCVFVMPIFAQPSMTPPEEIRKFGWMVGEWSGKMKWLMEGMEGEMDMTLKNEFEGQFLKTTSAMDMMGEKFTEVSFMGWDASKKRYSSWTFTNFAPLPRIEHGTMDGNKLVFISEPWLVMSEEPTVSRATLTKISDKEVSFTLEFKQEEKWEKVAEGTFKKKT
ncbi:MAG TPA: DUF1579 family protein [Fimbriimonadales bacterium]|nr:DUF1579 family protein [Fimbriimonadales bacterium]